MPINVKDKDILMSLVRFYKDFECFKDSNAVRKGYFKYSVEEIEETIQKLIIQTDKDAVTRKTAIRGEIQMIDSVEMAKQFYLKHLVYDKDEVSAKKNCLKNISLDELKLLYKKIYEKEVRTKITKEEVLSLIEKYFNGIDRALSMKP